MKIVQRCADAPKPELPGRIPIRSIATGTIFRYGSHSCGPYLKLQDGSVVDLRNSKIHYGPGSDTIIDGYEPLPAAYLVTGEE